MKIPNKKFFFSAWIFVHSLFVLVFLISFFISPSFSFKTSLFDILPPSSSLREVQSADSVFSERNSRMVTLLSKADSFEKAKDFAQKFYSFYADDSGVKNNDYFDSLALYSGEDSFGEISDWIHKNRFFLLGDDDFEEIREDALSKVFGAFTFADLSTLGEDPFLLGERSMERFLQSGAASATNMALRDGVLACEKDGKFYVLIRGLVSKKGSSFSGRKNSVRSIYETCSALKKEGAEFVFSGVPFHSYENSSSAQLQISVISFVSVILILAIFLLVFRSLLPAFVSVLAVIFSCGVGFTSVLLLFRSVHVLTFVFGTTLIGTCLDYSIHFFANWKANSSDESGEAVRNHIFRGISLGFFSTEICYAAFFFAPFPLLRQVSVFLFTGLLSAYLCVIALYPLISLPKNRNLPILNRNFSFFDKKYLSVLPLLILFFSFAVIFFCKDSFKIRNNIQNLYSVSDFLAQNEIESAKVLNSSSSGRYFIVKASDEQSLLEKNEVLDSFLKSQLSGGSLSGFLSCSQFVPSIKTQEKSFGRAKILLDFSKSQYEALGFEDNSAFFEKSYFDCEGNFIRIDDVSLPQAVKTLVANLWIGKIDDEFYSCVIPLNVSSETEALFKDFALNSEGIFFVDKVNDISVQLDELSGTMLKMLGIAFLIVLLSLLFCYKPRIVLKIALVPLIVVLFTTSVLVLMKVQLGFFTITALVLVFGLGLDYIIYAIEGSESGSKTSWLSIMLSFATTALSFGALSFSSFPPVFMLGITVFTGLLCAVVCAFCLKK